MAEHLHKLSPLTVDQFREYTPPGPLVQFVERYPGARVLDWGCGRGEFVLWLRLRGFDARGVDVDPDYVTNGQRGFRDHGEPASVLMTPHALSQTRRGTFDIVVSNMVLEHVVDLDGTAAAMRSWVKPGGLGRHLYPGRWRLREPHVGMPMVHWVPSRLRRLLLSGLITSRLASTPSWPEIRRSDRSTAVEVIDRYLATKTHYRRNSTILKSFRRAGFEARIETRDHRLRHRLPAPVARALIPTVLTAHLDLRAI